MLSSRLTPRILLAFACVYVFWGSTYLAMRVGVAVMPPFTLGAIRFLVAGSIMLAACGLRGLNLRLSRRDLLLQIAVGVLMLGLGNTGVAWAEQYLPSGLVSLLCAVIPIYVALLETVLPNGEGLRSRGWIGIALGLVGLLVLLSPHLLHDALHQHPGEAAGAIVAISAPLAWSLASVLARRAKFQSHALVSAGWQMLFGGIFSALVMPVLNGGRASHFTRQGALSVAYMIVFGSFVGYTSYVYLLENVPVAKVSTYAYVNPVVAVLLGAALLHERLVPVEYVGMAFILGAVYLVTSSKLKSGRPEAVLEAVPEESAA